MLSTIHTILRLLAIGRVLAHHGVTGLLDHLPPFRVISWFIGLNPFTRRYHRTTPRGVRLRRAMEELGPTFIKFGQALSTRMEVVPEDVGLEIKKLQDAVPPFPFAVVKATVERELGRPLEELYREFAEQPVASASMAQVHKAVTHDGAVVAVKVIRPGIESVVEKDIRMMRTLARLIEENIPEWRRFKAVRVVEEFASTIRLEMNFQVEASRAQQLAKNFEKDSILHVPEVFWGMSSSRVLTMEWIDGIPINELPKRPEMGIDVDQVSRNAVTIFFKQVFRDGYFHADLHPGNMFVRYDGTISFVDFGIVGNVSMQTRLWLADMLKAFLTRNYRKVAQVHLDAGYVPPDTNLEEFEEACRMIGEPVFGQPLGEISVANLLAQLFKTTERFHMEVQPQLLLLQKTMLTLEGVGRELNPDLNVWLLAEPLIRDWMMEHLGPKGKLRTFKEGVEHLNHVAWVLPELLHTTLDRMSHDRLQIRLHPGSLAPLERRVATGARRQSLTTSGAALFIGATVLAAAGFTPWAYGPLMGYGLFNMMRGTRAIH